jgi:3',5'-cyclic-AMP phosphodiesterase
MSTSTSFSRTRRRFLSAGAASLAVTALPVTMIEIARGREKDNFMFAYISDAHLQHLGGTRFVRNWDRGLLRAVAETNLLNPAPDFVIFGGDLAAAGTRPELDHGAELLSRLRAPVHHCMGEADYYLDLGEYWTHLFGPPWYSFDHKGVHFVVLNSVLTSEEALKSRWATPEQRVLAMTVPGSPDSAPFMVGAKQRAWLAEDLKPRGRRTPIVVMSHSPLQRIYRGWNFWTEDAEEVQSLLKPFEKVTVLYGHVHQLQYGQVGSIAFCSAAATAWPYPYPQSYAQEPSYLPKLTVPMNRADPFFDRDGTGWQFVNMADGNAETYNNLYNNSPRTIALRSPSGEPRDATYQLAEARIPPQTHY